jgi:hypothetical protein
MLNGRVFFEAKFEYQRQTAADQVHHVGAGRRHPMKQQVTRLSPHQNGKVFAVLMAVGSLIFIVPFFLFIFATAPVQARPPMFLFLLMPVFYLVFGYISVVLGCALYNFMYRYVGGVEFEARSESA